MRDAFGIRSWAERATSETLPSLCVGGVPVIDIQPASVPPALAGAPHHGSAQSRRDVEVTLTGPASASPAQRGAAMASLPVARAG
jgi:hypothetical protein